MNYLSPRWATVPVVRLRRIRRLRDDRRTWALATVTLHTRLMRTNRPQVAQAIDCFHDDVIIYAGNVLRLIRLRPRVKSGCADIWMSLYLVVYPPPSDPITYPNPIPNPDANTSHNPDATSADPQASGHFGSKTLRT